MSARTQLGRQSSRGKQVKLVIVLQHVAGFLLQTVLMIKQRM
jgi:hypothetical protein